MKMFILITLGILLVTISFVILQSKKDTLGAGELSCRSEQGIVTCLYNAFFANASSTVCSFPSLEATSTVIHASLKLNTGTSTDNSFQIGESTGPANIQTVYASGGFASTSNPNVNERETGLIVATSSLWESDNWVLPPKIGTTSQSYVNFIFGTSFGWNKSDGNCQLILRVL